MKEPGRIVFAAVAALKGDRDFQTFVKYLAEALDLCKSQLMGQPEDLYIRWKQGEAQTLSKILDTIREADAYLKSHASENQKGVI